MLAMVSFVISSVCHEVVFDADELVCLQCDCSFESRNALLIAVREFMSGEQLLAVL